MWTYRGCFLICTNIININTLSVSSNIMIISILLDTVRIPISLMLAGFRLLRFGMVLSGEHIDPIDGVRFGGNTKLNAYCRRVGSRFEDTEQNIKKQGPLWSKYYPNNEAGK